MLLMLHYRAVQYTRRKALFAHFHIHELTDAHNWLVLLWLAERVCHPSHPLVLAMDVCGIIEIWTRFFLMSSFILRFLSCHAYFLFSLQGLCSRLLAWMLMWPGSDLIMWRWNWGIFQSEGVNILLNLLLVSNSLTLLCFFYVKMAKPLHVL